MPHYFKVEFLEFMHANEYGGLLLFQFQTLEMKSALSDILTMSRRVQSILYLSWNPSHRQQYPIPLLSNTNSSTLYYFHWHQMKINRFLIARVFFVSDFAHMHELDPFNAGKLNI